MTNEEIWVFASTITYNWNRTEIIFKNGYKIYGYFDGNIVDSELYQQNKWNFILIPQENDATNPTLFDGNDFEKITIINIYPEQEMDNTIYL